MTAVEWLQEALSLTFEQEMQFEGLFQQAKEIEKQQIIDAYKYGNQSDVYFKPEQYYKETFNLSQQDKP
jgi:hypothetical protein